MKPTTAFVIVDADGDALTGTCGPIRHEVIEQWERDTEMTWDEHKENGYQCVKVGITEVE